MKKLIFILMMTLTLVSCSSPEAYYIEPRNYNFNPNPISNYFPYLYKDYSDPEFGFKAALYMELIDYHRNEKIPESMMTKLRSYGGDWKAIVEISKGYTLKLWKKDGGDEFYKVHLNYSRIKEFNPFYDRIEKLLGDFMYARIYRSEVNMYQSYLYSIEHEELPEYFLTYNHRYVYVSQVKTDL